MSTKPRKMTAPPQLALDFEKSKSSQSAAPASSEATLSPLETLALAKLIPPEAVKAANALVAPGKHPLKLSLVLEGFLTKGKPPKPRAATFPRKGEVVLALFAERMGGLEGDDLETLAKEIFLEAAKLTDEGERELLALHPEVSRAVKATEEALALPPIPAEGPVKVVAGLKRK